MHVFSGVVDLYVENSRKDVFYWFLLEKMIFLTNYRSSHTFLFYAKQKVWIIPEILSPFPASYDKISLLWLLAKFAKKSNFGRIWCIFKISMKMWKLDFFADFARSHRSEILSYNDGKGLKILEKIHTFCLEQNKNMCELLKLVKNTIFPSKNQ